MTNATAVLQDTQVIAVSNGRVSFFHKLSEDIALPDDVVVQHNGLEGPVLMKEVDGCSRKGETVSVD